MRYEMGPIDDGALAFPCETCHGSGVVGKTRCLVCSGSGYGPPPPALDRLRSHCLERLARWAKRNLPPPEEMED